MQTQQPKQREDWRRRREKYLRESGRHIELMKEGYECGDSSKDWAVIVGRGERGDFGATCSWRTTVPGEDRRAATQVRRKEGTRQAHGRTRADAACFIGRVRPFPRGEMK